MLLMSYGEHGIILYMSTTLMTLCIVHDDKRILLGYKKIGFGAGFWNGFGGKVEQGETVSEAAKRELHEEVGLTANDLAYMGILQFRTERSQNVKEVHVFRVSTWIGEPRESEEMRPQWFVLEQISYDTMWPPDRHWLPMFLDGKKFIGDFVFRMRGDIKEIVSYTLDEVKTL